MGSLRSSPLVRVPRRTLTELVDRRVAAAMKRHEIARDETAELRREVQQLRERTRTFELLLDGAGRGTARMPSPANLAGLQREITGLCGDPEAAERNVHGAFRLLVALESLGVGRIAGGTMNICGKLATVPLLARTDGAELEMLEIGTLYGLFAAALLRMTERTGATPSLTIVDPLVGMQLQNQAAIPADASGTPVAAAAVRTNLALAGAAGGAARIVVGLSGDADVRATVGDRRYGVVVVDGDHGYEGVAEDLRWVEQIVAPGGIVVLDDYGDGKWPGVQRALQDHLAGDSRLTLLGRVATSGYLRAA
ncbi:class I SAM-dependent methyltransferase [Jatrophihabitans endophyticus]|nr:class I SAM-dependent methyltransferase [Jatrophihabitans endophyticus]